MTPSMMVTHQSHHGSTHGESSILVILANVMAPGLLILRSTFLAGGDIGSTLLTTLLVMAGNRWGGRGFYCFLFLWKHFSGDNFLG